MKWSVSNLTWVHFAMLTLLCRAEAMLHIPKKYFSDFTCERTVLRHTLAHKVDKPWMLFKFSSASKKLCTLVKWELSSLRISAALWEQKALKSFCIFL